MVQLVPTDKYSQNKAWLTIKKSFENIQTEGTTFQLIVPETTDRREM